MSTETKPHIEVKNVIKDFVVGDQTINVIKGVDLTVMPGDFVMLHGPSGCGKSTLLHIINGWESPTNGEVKILGEDIYKKNEDQRAVMCFHDIAMVHQTSYWLKSLTVLENIAIPQLLSNNSRKIADAKAMELLKLLNLEKFAHYKPMDLSGGQQQRVSFLRSIINNPKIIMADEPTGNLDTSASQVIMELFSAINYQLKRTVVMVTHNLDLLKYGTKIVNMIDGKIIDIKDNENKNQAKIEKLEEILKKVNEEIK